MVRDDDGRSGEARREARELIRPNLDTPLIGSDIDERALGMARLHARNAGVDADVTFEKGAFKEIAPRRKYGCLVCNPPYGERSGDVAQAEELARETAAIFRRLDGRTMAVHEYAAELAWGAGRLIVSTLRFESGVGEQPSGISRSPAASHLLSCWVRYLCTRD